MGFTEYAVPSAAVVTEVNNDVIAPGFLEALNVNKLVQFGGNGVCN